MATYFLPGPVGREVGISWARFKSKCRGEPLADPGPDFVRLVDGEFRVVSSVLVPCGSCLGCREDKARSWSLRAELECERWHGGLFLTLTYNDLHLPSDLIPVKRDLQLFFKRFRKAMGVDGIRYMACGEKGEQFGRPHYHALVFGPGCNLADLEGLRVLRPGEHALYEWPLLDSCWPFGFSSVGDVEPASCLYVARYGLKSLDSGGSFLLTSRRPGLGYPAENAGTSVYLRGKRPSPSYFRRLFLDRLDPSERVSRLLGLSSSIEDEARFRGTSVEDAGDLLESFRLSKLSKSFRV